MVESSMMKGKKYPGLTAIELIIVVGTLVFLALLFSFSLNASQDQIRDAKRVADVNTIQTAVEFYYNANGQYPIVETEPGNQWGNLDDLLAEYLPEGELPQPPTGGENYVYLNSGREPQHFVVGAVLEQGSNKNLSNDSDESYPAASEWVEAAGVLSSGGSISTIACADNVYCVTE